MVAGSRAAWLFLLCLSCGSRSSLLTADDGASGGTAGSGAHTATGGSSGTGGASGGAGGSVGGTAGVAGTGAAGRAACNALELTPPILQIEQTAAPKYQDGAPLATWSSAGGEQVTIAFARKPLQAPSSAANLRLSTLAPWGPWPATPNAVLSSHELLTGEVIPVAALDRGLSGGISLAFPLAGSPMFAPQIDPDQPASFTTTALSGQAPAFVSRANGGRFLVGTRTELAAKLIVSEIDVTIGSAAVVAENVLACGVGHLPADAVPYQDGWLVAAWNHIPDCSLPPGPGSEAPRLEVVRVHAGGKVQPFFPLSSVPIADVRLAPDAHGAWFVHRTSMAGEAERLRIGKALVSSAAIIELPDVSQNGDVPLDFDVGLMGDRLVIAWVNQLPSGERALMLSLRDPNGFPLSVFSLERSLHGPPAIVPAPDGRGVLVAWQTWPGLRIEVGRFDCAQ